MSSSLRIALLHLGPTTGDLIHNCKLVDTATRMAAAMGADWVVTPELCLSGYLFTGKMGTDWIITHPDNWTSHFCKLAAKLRITMFLGHQERDSHTDKVYNSVFVIGSDGTILGKHRKVNVVQVCEGWATRGPEPRPISIGSLSVGILICADSWTPDVAQSLKNHGAPLLVSSAAWPPRPHGPEGCWERRSQETGLPLFVCNRTGIDETLDCRESQSVVVNNGQLVTAFESDTSAIVLVEWNSAINEVTSHKSVALRG